LARTHYSIERACRAGSHGVRRTEGWLEVQVNTVLGGIAPADLGWTLPHEHLLIDLYVRFQPHREYMLFDVDLACAELAMFASAGGRTLVNVTTNDIGRSPIRLREIARRTGVNVVMGTGRYREPFYEPALWETPTQAIADMFIREIEVGTDDGIKAGVIGEIGVHRRHVSPVEERIHRAAARAQVRTGLALTTHSIASTVGLAQLDIFEEEGVDLRRVVIGHSDTYPDLDYHRALIRRGAFVQFDTIRGASDYETMRTVGLITALTEEGHLEHILLSQDVCATGHLVAYGGTGYSYLISSFVGLLRKAGLAQEQVEQMFIGNPRRMLTGSA
jgi:phosphotriesterase-related protein